MSTYALAVDIGGTFTDAVLLCSDGRAWTDKKLTTYRDLLDGFLAAVDVVLAQAGKQPSDIDDVIVHATTLVTNSVIERKGAKTALLLTSGFTDLLYMRDESRSNIFDNQLEFVEPLVPRDLTYGIEERVLADGVVTKPVDPVQVGRIVDELVAKGVASVAVCLLHSYKRAAHEQEVAAVIRRRAPDMFISLSSEVAPQIREYWRASTTAINAYTMPKTLPYLQALAVRLRKRGFTQSALIMLSSGGVIGGEVAGQFPVRMIESGPAAGALASRYFSKQLAMPTLLSFDMGGTTAKASFIQGGEPLVTGMFEVARKYRFQPGSGMPVILPCIDIIEIGAGGGSIAHVDSLGLLTVGPDSAGSEPGPVCYGRGGTAPTVTDADLVLGILNPASFLGGKMTLDVAGAEQAFARLGEKLKLDARAAALGVYKIVCDSMAAAIRSHAADSGLDWRNLSILAFGGAGPAHACFVAEQLESREVIFPPLASVLSAFGSLVSPVRLDLARGYMRRLGDIDWDAVEQLRKSMIDEGGQALVAAGAATASVRHAFSADMRYFGQQYEINVDVPSESLAVRDINLMRQRFEETYRKQYGITLPDVDVEIVTWRLCVYGPEPTHLHVWRPGEKTSVAAASRQVQFPTGMADAAVYLRSSLAPGKVTAGPALIEEADTTIVVLPGWDFSVDNTGCIIARRSVQADDRVGRKEHVTAG